MLLDEINVNHEGTYDFFYLPIDFKNKCNVGYCFINFLEPKCIVPFVKEFNGQRWKSFNSEKVCAITFARIQGKASMVARFQNSSLLEKDDEYRPLLFHSTGPERGKPESFPLSANKDRNNMVSAGGLVYIPHHTLSHHHHPDNLNDMGHGGHGGDASINSNNTRTSIALLQPSMTRKRCLRLLPRYLLQLQHQHQQQHWIQAAVGAMLLVVVVVLPTTTLSVKRLNEQPPWPLYGLSSEIIFVVFFRQCASA